MAKKRQLERESKAYEPFLAKVEIDHPVDGPLEIELPRVDMKCIMRVSNSVSRLAKIIQENLPSGLFDQATDPNNPERANAGTALIQLIPTILPTILTEVTTVLVEYLEEEEEWLTALEPDDILNLFSPFLIRIFEIGTSTFSRFATPQESVNQVSTNEPSENTEASPIQE